MNTLHLTPALARQIEAEGVSTYPNECCGALIGKDTPGGRFVVRLEPMKNVFDPELQRRRFTIDPLEQMRVERAADAAGLAVVGYYHSHPDHPARPSETDRQHAWPYYSYIIVSIASAQPVDMTSWLLDEASQTFSRQDIVESEETAA